VSGGGGGHGGFLGGLSRSLNQRRMVARGGDGRRALAVLLVALALCTWGKGVRTERHSKENRVEGRQEGRRRRGPHAGARPKWR
jgi:hypothetical protein